MACGDPGEVGDILGLEKVEVRGTAEMMAVLAHPHRMMLLT